jgi:hypothetical protein
MTDTIDPGAPRTDELARNAALHALTDAIREVGYNFYGSGPEGDPEVVAGRLTSDHTVTWETDVNSAGVPVRRYVMRGEWEVDPNGLRAALDAMPGPDPAELSRGVPAVGSTVRLLGREWKVQHTYPTKQGWTALDMLATDGSQDEANVVPHFKVEPTTRKCTSCGKDTAARGPHCPSA